MRGNMVTEIDRDELKQKLDHPKKSILVEALPADHFRKLHLPGAIKIPADQVRSLAPEQLPNEYVEVIAYSADPACHASREAADQLTPRRNSHVRNYGGGKD